VRELTYTKHNAKPAKQPLSQWDVAADRILVATIAAKLPSGSLPELLDAGMARTTGNVLDIMG
jgi:hypothetical protein